MNPVEYKGAHLMIVEAFAQREPKDKVGEYWGDDAAAPVKAAIKTHYIAEQNFTCCYCRQQVLQANHDVWDAEHIIPKDTHPQFIFEPLNLAVSCGPCNEAKGDQNVLKNKKRKTFPDKSSDYIIVHPHFDNYDEHILWWGHVVAPNGSDKGQKTIEMCKLLRFAAKHGRFNSDLLGSAYREGVGKLMQTRELRDSEAIRASLDVHLRSLPR